MFFTRHLKTNKTKEKTKYNKQIEMKKKSIKGQTGTLLCKYVEKLLNINKISPID